MSKPNVGPTPTPQAQGETNKVEKNGGYKPSAPTPNPKSNVTPLPGMCMAEDCKKRSEKANFCMEHFDWFKEGLITKEGKRPTDFDKKHSDYTRRIAKKKSA